MNPEKFSELNDEVQRLDRQSSGELDVERVAAPGGVVNVEFRLSWDGTQEEDDE